MDHAEVAASSIEVYVRSGPWDALAPPDRVSLLKRTYDLIRSQYPGVTRLVRLIFDDGRADLDFRFDDP